MVELFTNDETTKAFEKQTTKLIQTIKAFSDEKILNTDLDEWIIYYFEEYKIQPIVLLLENISQNLSQTTVKKLNPFRQNNYESEYLDVDGYKIIFKIPFDGDSNLLFLKPITHILSRFYVEQIIESTEKSYGKIIFALKYTEKELAGKDKEFIKMQFDQHFKSYVKNIEYINRDVAEYNNNLENVIRNTLDKRKEKAKGFISVSKKLNIPLKLNPDAPNISPILLKKAVIKKPKIPSIQQSEKQYQIASADYENIKQIINLAGISMEKAVKTFSKLSEEELRDVIISYLNTHYQGLASAETFSRIGKTDIYILFENKAAYIGECKIWHGEKKLQEAIKQLFGYITWRDLKTSIIIFNKDNKDFDKLLKVIGTYLSKNDMCQKNISVNHNEWLCEFKKDVDNINYITVQIVVFDLYTE